MITIGIVFSIFFISCVEGLLLKVNFRMINGGKLELEEKNIRKRFCVIQSIHLILSVLCLVYILMMLTEKIL